MRILSWNCQGLGSKWTISYLRDIWFKQKPEFLFLSETKQPRVFVEQFLSHLGYEELYTVEPSGASGGLALFYNKEFEVNIISANNRIIDTEIKVKKKRVYISFVYGEPVQQLRDQVWERITRLGTIRNSPWMIIGDLNEITGNHEKEGGPLRHAKSFVPFNTMISDCGFIDFPSVGNNLSWRGIRGSQVIRCRLDRALANEEWHDSFPISFVEYLGMVGSDHRPIVANMEDSVRKRKRQFRFDKTWIGKEGFMETVKSGWRTSGQNGKETIVDRIRNCRHFISVWRKNNVSEIKERIMELKLELDKVQQDNSKTEQEIRQVAEALKEAY